MMKHSFQVIVCGGKKDFELTARPFCGVTLSFAVIALGGSQIYLIVFDRRKGKVEGSMNEF